MRGAILVVVRHALEVGLANVLRREQIFGVSPVSKKLMIINSAVLADMMGIDVSNL